MGTQRIKFVKEKKPFAPLDVIVYAALAVLVAVLFAVFVFGADKTPLTGIRFVYGEETVFTYSFADGASVSAGWEDRIAVEEEGDLVRVTFYADAEKTEYNVLAIDKAQRMAKMEDANCSRRKDCMYMRPIETVSGVIVCVPHGLKITALNGQEDFSHPSLG